jgi:hypothetical protein
MSQTALDTFGELLMTKVRDKAILDWEMIISGRMKGEQTASVLKARAWSPENKALFLSLVPEIVDSVLHHLLWTFEQNEHVRIAVDLPDEQVESLNAISDGFPGELYSDEGWIARFSTKPNPWLSTS